MPYKIWNWRADNPGVEYTHDQNWVSNDPGGPARGIRASRTIYHYSADRARRTTKIKDIDESLRKARNIAEGKTPVKVNRYVKMGKATKVVNLELACHHRELAGVRAQATSRLNEDPMVITVYYRRSFNIKWSFRGGEVGPSHPAGVSYAQRIF